MKCCWWPAGRGRRLDLGACESETSLVQGPRDLGLSLRARTPDSIVEPGPSPSGRRCRPEGRRKPWNRSTTGSLDWTFTATVNNIVLAGFGRYGCAMADLVDSVARRYAVMRPHLSEFQRRLWLGAGRGGRVGAGGVTGRRPIPLRERRSSPRHPEWSARPRPGATAGRPPPGCGRRRPRAAQCVCGRTALAPAVDR